MNKDVSSGSSHRPAPSSAGPSLHTSPRVAHGGPSSPLPRRPRPQGRRHSAFSLLVYTYPYHLKLAIT